MSNRKRRFFVCYQIRNDLADKQASPPKGDGLYCREPEGGCGVEQLIDAFLDHLTVERGLASNTCVAYRADLAQFTDFLQRRGIQHLNGAQRQHITDYLLHRRKGGLSARSLSRHLAAI